MNPNTGIPHFDKAVGYLLHSLDHIRDNRPRLGAVKLYCLTAMTLCGCITMDGTGVASNIDVSEFFIL